MPYWRSVHISRSPAGNREGGLNPVPAPPDPREAIRAALGGISAEVAGLPWDWRERTAEERADDEWSAFERIASPSDRIAAKFEFMVRGRA